MMTQEEKEARKAEKKAKEAAELRATLLAPRAGTKGATGTHAIPDSTPSATAGLDLSDIQHKPIAWLIPDPDNDADFAQAKAKRPGYWRDLKADIEKNGILVPLLATPTGHLLQGHSRLQVAKELGLARVPVQLIIGGLPTDPAALAAELRNRRRLDNLLRFDLDDAHRLAMLAEIYPAFYTRPGKAGNPKLQSGHDGTIGQDTPKLQSAHGDTIGQLQTAPDIAKATGKSVATVKRDRATVVKATQIAKAEGLTLPKPKHIEAAKQELAPKRKAAAAGHGSYNNALYELLRIMHGRHVMLPLVNEIINALSGAGYIPAAERDAFIKALKKGDY